jgi:hypothetical protein
VSLPSLEQPFVIGSAQTCIGKVPRVSSALAWTDHWGTVKARWGVGRMRYTIEPGLYALGQPDPEAPVLVTANYKMSFDRLRETLSGRNAWILVLNTEGVNVWCAAGKGTFGTAELVQRIAASRLAEVVSHRRLILPQLAGPGVSAHQVRKLSGFKVTYGPIRASDLPAFLDSGLKASPEMRRKTFTLRERAALIPVELVGALKSAAPVLVVLFFLSGLGVGPGYWSKAWSAGGFSGIALLIAILAGAVLTPLLLPWLPGRAFSVKGLVTGLALAAGLMALRGYDLRLLADRLETLGWLFMIPTVSAYLAMNFTGASTYTSLSGVRKEMRWAVPVEIGAACAGLCLWVASRFVH